MKCEDFPVSVDLGNLLTTLEDVARCPICLDMVKPPVIICINGHGICSTCLTTLTKCPACRKPFSNIRPRILNEILLKLPKFCKFYDNRCRLPAIGDHELYCEWRVIKCILPEDLHSQNRCSWKGPFKSWPAHLMDEHQKQYLPDQKQQLFFGNFKTLLKTKSPFIITPPEMIFDYLVFILYHAKANGNFNFWIKCCSLDRPKSETSFTISFGSSIKDIVYKYKIKATEMVLLEKEMKMEENVYCMQVPLEELTKLVDEYGDLNAFYEVTTEPLPDRNG